MQEKRNNPPPLSPRNEEFHRLHEERASKFKAQGMSIPDLNGPTHPLAFVIDGIWDRVVKLLPSPIADWARTHLAVGLADHTLVNATCLRSTDGYYAIVLHTGLMVLFNKVSKILAAITNPKWLVYYERGPVEAVTRQSMVECYESVTRSYRDTRVPLGPRIVLTDEGNQGHVTQLAYWETFVLCHELGHLVCGHLEDPRRWAKGQSASEEAYSGSNAHVAEHQADIFAFLLCREAFPQVNGEEGDAHELRLIAFATGLFDLMYSIGGTGSPNHPHALDRLLVIIHYVYGEDASKILASTYETGESVGVLNGHKLVPSTNATSFLEECGRSRKDVAASGQPEVSCLFHG